MQAVQGTDERISVDIFVSLDGLLCTGHTDTLITFALSARSTEKLIVKTGRQPLGQGKIVDNEPDTAIDQIDD